MNVWAMYKWNSFVLSLKNSNKAVGFSLHFKWIYTEQIRSREREIERASKKKRRKSLHKFLQIERKGRRKKRKATASTKFRNYYNRLDHKLEVCIINCWTERKENSNQTKHGLFSFVFALCCSSPLKIVMDQNYTVFKCHSYCVCFFLLFFVVVCFIFVARQHCSFFRLFLYSR